MFLRASRAPGGADFSFIGPEMTVRGDIETTGRLHIDGHVVGDVRCRVLVQGEGGSVAGNIVADEVRLAGLVGGAVDAGSLALEASAQVTGDVLYESVSIVRGAAVEGRFRRRKGAGEGSAAAKVEAAPSATPRPRRQGKRAIAELFPPLPEAEAAE